jgi:ABC-2 type transport system permease protein
VTVFTFIWKEAAILRRNLGISIYLFVVPISLTLILSHTIGSLPGIGRGVDQALPGYAVMFGYYVIAFLGSSHFREHTWGTWTLVRVSGMSRLGMASCVAVPYFMLSVLQTLGVLVTGWLVLGAEMRGSWVGVLVITIANSVAIIGIGMLLVSLTRQVSQLQNLTQLVVLGLGGVSGALVPTTMLPAWAQAAAPLTPQYWSVEALRALMSKGVGLPECTLHLATLIGIGSLGLAVAAWKFDPAREHSSVMN